jgi:hypothetical protein
MRAGSGGRGQTIEVASNGSKDFALAATDEEGIKLNKKKNRRNAKSAVRGE